MTPSDSPPGAAPPPTTATRTRSGYTRSFGGFAGALIALFVCAGVFWLLTLVLSQPEPNTMKRVDYAAPLAQARAGAPYDVVAAEPVPRGWRPTSVSYDVNGPVKTWRLGYHDADGTSFVGITQSNAAADEVIDDATPARQPTGTRRVAGHRWMLMTSDDEAALVLAEGKVTTVVTGNVPPATIVTFVRALA